MYRLEAKDFFESPQFPFHIETYRFKPSEFVEPHVHDFVELAYVSEGQGFHSYNNVEHEIHEGDCFIIDPEQVHSYRSHEQEQLIVNNILFQPSLLRAELELLGSFQTFMDFFYVEPFLRNSQGFQSHLKLRSSEKIEMKTIVQRILSEYSEKALGYHIVCKTQLIELFVFLSRCYDKIQRKPLLSHDSDQLRMKRIAEFITQHYEQPLTLQQVSRMCGMSQSTFSLKFKQYCAQTFIEFRNEIRIKAALNHLEHGENKIAQIAQDVGFEDLSFFNQQFKQATGFTPRQYRKACVQKKNQTESLPSG